jgi:hypothetical protein
MFQFQIFEKPITTSILNTLLTSGYKVVSNNRTPGPLDTPQIAGIDNSVSRQLTVRGGAVLNGRMYQLQFSWIDFRQQHGVEHDRSG